MIFALSLHTAYKLFHNNAQSRTEGWVYHRLIPFIMGGKLMEDKNNFAAIKKRKTAIYTLIQVVGILLLMFIGNAFDFLNLKFTFEKITTWDYWNGVIQQMLMYSIALVVGYMGRLETLVLKDTEFARLMDEYHLKYKLKTPTFGYWVETILNPDIQKEFFKIYLEDKLHKLDNHAKDEWRKEYINLLDSGIKIDYWEFKDKKSERYIRKRLMYEEMLIDKNLEKAARAYSKYPRVSSYSFTWGLNSNDKYGAQYQVENKTGKVVALAAIRKMLSVALAAILIGAIASDVNGEQILETAAQWWALIVKYIIRCLSIAWSYATGLYMGKSVFQTQYIMVIENRNRILDQYIRWQTKSGERDTPTYKVLAYLQSQIKSDKELVEKQEEVENGNK